MKAVLLKVSLHRASLTGAQQIEEGMHVLVPELHYVQQ